MNFSQNSIDFKIDSPLRVPDDQFIHLDENERFAQFKQYESQLDSAYSAAKTALYRDFLRKWFLETGERFDCGHHEHIVTEDMASTKYVALDPFLFPLTTPCVRSALSKMYINVTSGQIATKGMRATKPLPLVIRDLALTILNNAGVDTSDLYIGYEAYVAKRVASHNSCGDSPLSSVDDNDSPGEQQHYEQAISHLQQIERNQESILFPEDFETLPASRCAEDHGLHTLLEVYPPTAKGKPPDILNTINDLRVKFGYQAISYAEIALAMKRCTRCTPNKRKLRPVGLPPTIIYVEPELDSLHILEQEHLVAVHTRWLPHQGIFEDVVKPILTEGISVVTDRMRFISPSYTYTHYMVPDADRNDDLLQGLFDLAKLHSKQASVFIDRFSGLPLKMRIQELKLFMHLHFVQTSLRLRFAVT